MFSRLFKTPKSSLQLFRKNQAAMLPNDAESPQVPPETFSSLPIIRKVGLKPPRYLRRFFDIIKPFFWEARKRIPKEQDITLQSNRLGE